MIATPRSLGPLVVVTLTNYVALVPYYIHNEYLRSDGGAHHGLPGPRAVLLVALTLSWFVAGVRGAARRRRWGRPVLLSFLIAEASLYVKTFATGAFVHQMQNPSDLVRVVFVIGYVSGAVALVYLALLGRTGRSTPPTPDRPDSLSPGPRRRSRWGRGSRGDHRSVATACTS